MNNNSRAIAEGDSTRMKMRASVRSPNILQVPPREKELNEDTVVEAVA